MAMRSRRNCCDANAGNKPLRARSATNLWAIGRALLTCFLREGVDELRGRVSKLTGFIDRLSSLGPPLRRQVRALAMLVAAVLVSSLAAPAPAAAQDQFQARTPGFAVQVEPSPTLTEAMREEGPDAVMTYARREFDACVAEFPKEHCLELLTIETDAQIAWLERYGDFGRDEDPEGEGMILRHTRDFRRIIDKEGIYGFDARIFSAAYGNYARAQTHYGRLAEAEEGLRYALQYRIVALSEVPTAEWQFDLTVPSAALALARNLALQGDFDNARAFLEAAEAFTGTLLLFDGSEALPADVAAKAHREYLAVAALIPSEFSVPGAPPIYAEATAGYEVPRTYLDNRPDLSDRLQRDHARFLASTGSYADAIALIDQRPELLELSRDIDHHDTRAALGAAYLARGDREVALHLLEASTESLRFMLAVSDPRRIDAQIARGLARLEGPDAYRALAAADLREAVAGAVERIEDTTAIPALVGAVRRYRAAFEGLMQSLAADTIDRETAREVFMAAQWASTGETAATLAQVAATASRGDGPVAEKLREREDVRQQLVEDARAIAQEIKTIGWNVEDIVYKFYLRNVASVMLEGANEEIAALDPAFDQLVRPRPLELKQVQALLAVGEALLFVAPDPAGTTVFAITAADVGVHRSALTREDLSAAVEQLREELDVDLSEGSREAEDFFDEELAHGLYRELVAPLEPTIGASSRVMTVTPGPLSRLPLALLVTDPPVQGPRRYLIDRYELSTLPAVSSLFALRCLLREKARQPAGCGTEQGRAPRGAGEPVDLFAAGSPTLAGAPAKDRSVTSYSALFEAELADPAKVRQLAYLPGTRREIEAVSGLFDPARAQALTGDGATEGAVKSAAGLSRARFVLFSTHGLVSTDTGIMGEPALVFTPPEPGEQSPLDDGLLTASEVAQLSLVAEFVVLSACNTASPGAGSEADGLSGLAQAFFYAGAQSLLATHWPLSDASGAQLVAAMFESLSADPGQRRSAAFRAAINEVRARPEWTSPAFWAPFALVGTTD